MKEFKLTAKEIQTNWINFMNTIDKIFHDNPDRRDKLKEMYNDLKEDLMFAPASGYAHFHNAIPGGYIDHVNRVMKYSLKYYKLYMELGLKLDDFTKEELIFAAMNHDLGKAGFPGDGMQGYIYNESEWHRKNQGKMYVPNKRNPFSRVQDRSLFLLQKYGIECSWNEYLGILTHDGLYDEGNKSYFVSFKPEAKFRTNIVMLLHQADMAASRFEWERWATTSEEINLSRIDNPIGSDEPTPIKEEKPEEKNPFGNFSQVFEKSE